MFTYRSRPESTPSPLQRLPDARGPLAHLIQLAGSLLLIFGLVWGAGQTYLWWYGPSLQGVRKTAQHLASRTEDLDAQDIIAIVEADEIYTRTQLLAAYEILESATGELRQQFWLRAAAGLCLWTALVFASRLARTTHLARRPQTAPVGFAMGILHEGVFVPHALPVPQVARHSLATRWRRPPKWAEAITPMTPLARALLECYAAHPAWPAEPAGATPGRSAHTPGQLLRDHAVAVRQEALALAAGHGVPVPLAEAAALAHDVGKLISFAPEGHEYRRIHPHHDEMGALFLTGLPEWVTLSGEDRDDLGIAVAFHHHPDAVPRFASPRARALLALVRCADQDAVQQQKTAALAPLRAGAQAPTVTTASADAPSSVIDTTTQQPVGQGSSDTTNATGAAVVPGARSVPGAMCRTKTEPSVSRVVALPELCAALRAVVPTLRINSRPFDGYADPSMHLLLILDPALRTALAGAVNHDLEQQLRLKEDGDSLKAGAAHPATPLIAAAFQELGWLFDDHSLLWRVKLGRRVWPACWLLRLSAFPESLIAQWDAPRWHINVLDAFGTTTAAQATLPLTGPSATCDSATEVEQIDELPETAAPDDMVSGDGIEDLPAEHEVTDDLHEIDAR